MPWQPQACQQQQQQEQLQEGPSRPARVVLQVTSSRLRASLAAVLLLLLAVSVVVVVLESRVQQGLMLVTGELAGASGCVAKRVRHLLPHSSRSGRWVAVSPGACVDVSIM